MKFRFSHNNINVIDLERSLAFYRDALALTETRRKEASDGSYSIVFLGDGESAHKLELTWLRDWEKDSYNLGDNEFHLAFETDDLEAARAKHRKIDCIIYENKAMGIYFIVDPDGYWIEIVPTKR